MKERVVIVNLGTGNLRSVYRAFEFAGGKGDVTISADPEIIRDAERLVLPGQGAIGTWMGQLRRDSRLKGAVMERLSQGPVLGICLGLQALLDQSEENGGQQGLGVIPGEVRHFSPTHQAAGHGNLGLKIPHMGWNKVNQKIDHPLWHNIQDDERFYFVHSYYADASDQSTVVGESTFGNTFTCAVARDNLFATQFHPEKSQQAGLQLIKNFIHWNGVQ